MRITVHLPVEQNNLLCSRDIADFKSCSQTLGPAPYSAGSLFLSYSITPSASKLLLCEGKKIGLIFSPKLKKGMSAENHS